MLRARSAGTVSHFDIGLAQNLAETETANSAMKWILCHWLLLFPDPMGIWLSVLAAHDSNEGLLQALAASTKAWPNVYAGVFSVETLRPSSQLIRCLKNAGVAGVINFPSISFIDGEAGEVFSGLSLGVDREIDFLQNCSNAGLRIAGVTKSTEAAERLGNMGVDFLIAHGGAPTRENADPSQEAAIRVESAVRRHRTPVIPISRVLQCGRSRT
jgi:predicted TIM-barrel enzyme